MESERKRTEDRESKRVGCLENEIENGETECVGADRMQCDGHGALARV